VLYSMPRRSNIAKRSADVAGMVPGLQERHSRINRLPDTLFLAGWAPHDRHSRLQGARHDLRLSSRP